MKKLTLPHAVEGMWYMATGTNSSASSYPWLRDSLYRVEELCEKGQGWYKLMDEEAAQVPRFAWPDFHRIFREKGALF